MKMILLAQIYSCMTRTIPSTQDYKVSLLAGTVEALESKYVDYKKIDIFLRKSEN